MDRLEALWIPIKNNNNNNKKPEFTFYSQYDLVNRQQQYGNESNIFQHFYPEISQNKSRFIHLKDFFGGVKHAPA